jgi:ribosomal protein S12 methylthiotransferase
VLPYLDVPFQHSTPMCCKRMKRPASGERNLERLLKWREACPRSSCAPPSSPAFRARPKRSSNTCWTSCAKPQIDRAGCFAYSPVKGAAANDLPGMLPPNCVKSARPASWPWPKRCRSAKLQRRVGATMQVLVDHAPALGRKGGTGRSYADAPEIDGVVRLLPPEKASKT